MLQPGEAWLRALFSLCRFLRAATTAGALHCEDVGEEIDVGVDGGGHDLCEGNATKKGFQEHSDDDGAEGDAEEPSGSAAASREEESSADDQKSREDISPEEPKGGEWAKTCGSEAAEILNSPIVGEADEESGKTERRAYDHASDALRVTGEAAGGTTAEHGGNV